LVVTGIRAAESKNRARRKMTELCYRDSTKRYLHPIIDWLDEDVWEFIRLHNLPYCKLYDEGWKRIGCLFCPMRSSKLRLAETKRYPKYAIAFERAFERLYKKRGGRDAFSRWNSGKEMFRWWLTNEEKKDTEQIMIFER
jgi:phosphoadenosine phosphosulfate reductase